jgi:hypothetical protein
LATCGLRPTRLRSSSRISRAPGTTITVIGGLNFVTLDGSIVAAGDFDGDGRADLAGAGGIGLSIMPKVCVRSADLIP